MVNVGVLGQPQRDETAPQTFSRRQKGGARRRGDRMRRRDFLGLLAGATACPFAARTSERIPRIGYLSPLSAEEWDKALIQSFEAGLNELGYVPGKLAQAPG